MTNNQPLLLLEMKDDECPRKYDNGRKEVRLGETD